MDRCRPVSVFTHALPMRGAYALTISASPSHGSCRHTPRKFVDSAAEGSMREIRPGVWKLTVTTAPRHRVSSTINCDPQRAEIELARLAARHGHTPTTVDALVHLYLTHLRGADRSAATVRRYEQLWRTWLAPSLGTISPDDLDSRDVEAALTAMADARQSRRSIHQAAVVLNTAFAWAREHGLAGKNPVPDCELPDGTTLTGTRRRF